MRKIRISILKYFNSTPFDVYCFENGTYRKILKSNKYIGKEFLGNYERKGLKFLNIKKQDGVICFQYLRQKLEEIEKGSNKEKIDLLKELIRQMMESIFDTKTVEKFVFKQAQTLSKKIIKYATEGVEAIDLLINKEESDEETFESSLATSFLGLFFLDKFKLNSEKARTTLALGGLLHDIGKARIPSDVLNKPGRFNEEERKIMEEHPKLGVKMLRKVPSVPLEIIQIILQHHEDWNGGGYPVGHHRAREIYILAHLTSIIDVFAALICKRAYKSSYTPQEAIEIMIDMKRKFNPEMLRSFVSVFKGGKHYVEQIERTYQLKPFDEYVQIEHFLNVDLFNLENK